MTTRKEYQRTARILSEARKSPSAEELRLLRNLTVSFADKYEADNPRFDRERFLQASGFYRPEPDYF